MKKIYLTVLYSLLFVSVFGQNLNSLSLDEAVAYALKHSPAINIKQLSEQEAEQKLSKTKLDYLPNIYATSDLRRNLIIPATPIPASMLNPSASEDELMYMRFNTPWNSGAGVNLSFDIFNPETFGRKSEQEKLLNISRYDTQISKNDLQANVSQAYIDCVIAQTQLDAMIADTAYYAALLEDANNLFAKEKLALVDKNNSEINYNASLSRLSQAKNVLHNAKLALLFYLGESADEEKIEELNLTDDISSLYTKMSAEGLSENRVSLSQSRQSELISLSEIRVKNAALKYAPTLSLSGYYGANYFGKELKLGNTDRWFGNSFLALSLRVPISRSLSTAKEVSQMRLQEQAERENMREMQNRRSADLSREIAQLESDKANYELKKSNLSLINQNLSAKQLQLQKGYILESEMFSEKMRQQNLFQEYLQAAYDVLSGYISLKRLMIN